MSLKRLYEDLYNPTEETSVVYSIGGNSSNDAFHGAYATNIEAVHKLADYYATEDVLADKVIDVQISDDHSIVRIIYDMLGDGETETMDLNIHKVPLIG